MTIQVALGLAPLGGGTIQNGLTESIWLGGTRFFAVFAQTNPVGFIASIIDLSADPYTTGVTQTATTTQFLAATVPQDRPRLIRLDLNRVMMIWSATNTPDSYVTNPSANGFDVWVFEIDGSNNITIAVQQSQVVGAPFMNLTRAYTQPITSKGMLGVQAVTNAGGYNGNYPPCIVSAGWSTQALPISTDGAAINRVLIAWAGLPCNVSGTQAIQASIVEFQYTVAAKTLTISRRFQSGQTTYNTWGGNNMCYYGPNSFPWMYLIPGTTKLLFGHVNYDPITASHSNADPYISYTATSQFVTNNNMYVIDYGAASVTAGAVWTASTTVSTVRRASVVCPLDSDRMLEVTDQGYTSAAYNFARIYSLSGGTWTTADTVTDASLAQQNANGSVAWGTVSQITSLGNDHVLMGINPRLPQAAGTAVGTTTPGYWGVYQVVGTQFLQATGKLGVPALAPLTYQRGEDAFQQRTAALDPSSASPNVAYDFYGRTGALTYQFLRYANPS